MEYSQSRMKTSKVLDGEIHLGLHVATMTMCPAGGAVAIGWCRGGCNLKKRLHWVMKSSHPGSTRMKIASVGSSICASNDP